MKYFCYISEHKLDMLIQQIDPTIEDTTTEERTNERTTSVNPEVSGLLQVFGFAVSFGKHNPS